MWLKMGLWSDSKGASEGVNHYQRSWVPGRRWPVEWWPPGGPQTRPQERVQTGRAELSSFCFSHLPIHPAGSCSGISAEESGRGRRPPALLPRPPHWRCWRKTEVPQPGLCILALAPAPDVPLPSRTRRCLSEREDEGDEGTAVCSQGELQCHQAAAHCPVTGPDEETEEHTSRGLLHVIHEAPAQIALDTSIVMEELSRLCTTYCEQQHGHLVNLTFVCVTFLPVFSFRCPAQSVSS